MSLQQGIALLFANRRDPSPWFLHVVVLLVRLIAGPSPCPELAEAKRALGKQSY